MRTNKTILVVDDDRQFRAPIKAALTSAGYTVMEAASPDEAGEILNRDWRQIALVIVDLIFPKGSGFDLIGAITRRPTLMKIIATSGVLKPPYLEVVKYLGAHAVIEKRESFTPAQWVETVGALLEAENSIGAAAGEN